MGGAYAYTPAIWLPLTGVAFAVGMALYCWRRRDVPAVWPLFYVFAITALLCLASALSAAALDLDAKITWFRVSQACLLPGMTAGTCFVLEYVYPGRWLTRRNLLLLAAPPLLLTVLIFAGNGQLFWQAYTIGPSGTVMREPKIAAAIVSVYALGLSLLNAVALLWLFVRSPLHRWPAAMMLAGQLAGRTLAFVDICPATLDAAVRPPDRRHPHLVGVLCRRRVRLPHLRPPARRAAGRVPAIACRRSRLRCPGPRAQPQPGR